MITIILDISKLASGNNVQSKRGIGIKRGIKNTPTFKIRIRIPINGNCDDDANNKLKSGD